MTAGSRWLSVVLAIVLCAAATAASAYPSPSGHVHDVARSAVPPVVGDWADNPADEPVFNRAAASAAGFRVYDDSSSLARTNARLEGYRSAPQTTSELAHPAFRPGPFARESIPARSAARDFKFSEHAAIDKLGYREQGLAAARWLEYMRRGDLSNDSRDQRFSSKFSRARPRLRTCGHS